MLANMKVTFFGDFHVNITVTPWEKHFHNFTEK